MCKIISRSCYSTYYKIYYTSRYFASNNIRRINCIIECAVNNYYNQYKLRMYILRTFIRFLEYIKTCIRVYKMYLLLQKYLHL